jgi:hypothetical protein
MVGGGWPHRPPPAGNGGIHQITDSMETGLSRVGLSARLRTGLSRGGAEVAPADVKRGEPTQSYRRRVMARWVWCPPRGVRGPFQGVGAFHLPDQRPQDPPPAGPSGRGPRSRCGSVGPPLRTPTPRGAQVVDQVQGVAHGAAEPSRVGTTTLQGRSAVPCKHAGSAANRVVRPSHPWVHLSRWSAPRRRDRDVRGRPARLLPGCLCRTNGHRRRTCLGRMPPSCRLRRSVHGSIAMIA